MLGRRLTLLLWIVAATSCRGASDPGPGAVGSAGSCADVAFFNGHEYGGRTAVVYPTAGEVIGEARRPGCADTGQETPPPDEFVQVARLPGIDPNVAVVDAATPQVIYVRSDLGSLPEELERFFTAPSCVPADAPIALEGTWLGIIGPGETTELDMVPPYAVTMLVTLSSAARYVHAEIRIQVPSSLGSPLTRADVKASLWEEGTLRVRATCDGDRFVAESVQAFPP